MSDSLLERLRSLEIAEREVAFISIDPPANLTVNWEYAETAADAALEIERLRGLMKGWTSYAWKDDVYIDSVQEYFDEHLDAPTQPAKPKT